MLPLFLLNSKISNLQCYCVISAMVILNSLQSQWKKCWVCLNATATVAIKALSKNKIHHPTARAKNHVNEALVSQFAAQKTTWHHFICISKLAF